MRCNFNSEALKQELEGVLVVVAENVIETLATTPTEVGVARNF